MVESLHFPEVLDTKYEFNVAEARIQISSGVDEISQEALHLFNLVEVEGIGRNSRIYLDLTIPSSQALVLLSSGGFSAHELYYKPKEIDVKKCIDTFSDGAGKIFLQACVKDVIEKSYKSQMYDFSALMFNGYTPIWFEDFLKTNKPNHRSDDLESLEKAVNFGIWLADVFHPIDELESGYVIQPTNEHLRIFVNNLLEKELEVVRCSPCKKNQLVHDENRVVNWLDNKIQIVNKMYSRIAQIGPHSDHKKRFSNAEEIIIGNPIFEDLNCIIQKYYEFQQGISNRFFNEVNDKSHRSYTKYYDDTSMQINKENENSKRRTFLTIYKIVGLKEGLRKGREHAGIDRTLKMETMITPLFPNSSLPKSWPPKCPPESSKCPPKCPNK